MYQCGKTYGVGLKTWFSLIGLLLTVTRDHNQRYQEAGASSEAPNRSRPNRAPRDGVSSMPACQPQV